MDCQGALAATIVEAGAFYIVNGKLGEKYTQLPITVNGKYFPANSAINFQQISAVKNQQFIMPHISRGVSPGSVIYSNGRLTS